MVVWSSQVEHETLTGWQLLRILILQPDKRITSFMHVPVVIAYPV